jgi:hypothetical protein
LKTLYLRQLLDFYDYRVGPSISHASAINAVLGEDLAITLLCHYFTSAGATAEDLPIPCTTGRQRGHRLDRWIAVKSDDQQSIIYQVEIKNWSAHSIGGTVVDRNATASRLHEYRIDRWRRQFKMINNLHTPSQKETLKVLTKMNLPPTHRRYVEEGYIHKALLCFWEALHPTGNDDAFFTVDVASETFDQLQIFSMSNYVRKLLEHTETLDVAMLVTDARVDWLNSIYK